MAVDFTPDMREYTGQGKFRYWVQMVLPTIYDDSLSYMELLNKLVYVINLAIEDVDTVEANVADLLTAFNELQQYTNDYFDNLDVQEKINNKLDDMVSDGTFSLLLQPLIENYQEQLDLLEARVNNLTDTITPGSTSGDAELIDIRTGFNAQIYDNAGNSVRAQIKNIADNLKFFDAYNLLGYQPKTNRTSEGITYNWNGDTCVINGSNTEYSICNIYYDSAQFPTYLEKNVDYIFEVDNTNVYLDVYVYTPSSSRVVRTNDSVLYRFGDDVIGLLIRLFIPADSELNNISVTPRIYKRSAALDDIAELKTKVNEQNITLDFRATLNDDETINILNPETITENYIMTPNGESAITGYYYTDYLKTGENVFYHSQVGNLTYQCICYDGDYNYIGYIDHATHTENLKTFTSLRGANYGYREFTPLENTVYVRLNGSLTRPKTVTPFFAPIAYGAKTQTLSYLEKFKKFQSKMAMFGDSITLGRDGNSTNIYSENIPYYIQGLTNFKVDNYGVGSMGWVSTQYTDQIAYDKISATDLSNYDVITLCYGVNDTGATIGDYDSTNESTVMGQFNKVINYISAQNNTAKTIVIAPFNTASGVFPEWRYPRIVSGSSRQEMANTIKQACDYYHIPFISQDDSPLYGYGIGTPDNTLTRQFIGNDDVHPTWAGYYALGHWLAGKINAIVK